MKKLIFTLSCFFIIFCIQTATAQWAYFSATDGFYDYNYDLTELDNGYFASVGLRRSLPWGGVPFIPYLIVVDADGQEVFTKIFEEEEGVFLTNVLAVANGLCLVGTKKIDSLSTNNIYVSKINYENQVEWEATYNQRAYSARWVDAILLPDTTISIIFPEKDEVTGNADSTGLLKIAMDGTLLSSVTVEVDEFDLHRSMTLGADGNLLITGKINDSMYLQKIDMEGHEIWKKTFFPMFFPSSSDPSEGRKIIIADDGEIILLGWIDRGQGFGGKLGKTVLIKTDNDGNLLWEKVYNLAPNTDGRDICKMDDGGFILVGELGFDDVGSPELFLSKIDSEGLMEWKKDYLYTSSSTAFSVYGRNIVKTTGDYIVFAAKGEQHELYITKIDTEEGIVKTEALDDSFVSKINLSPIPVTSVLNIDFILEEKTNLTIEIVNLMGQTVDIIATEVMHTKGEHHINMDSRNLLSGFYQVLIRTERGRVAKGFVRN